MSVEARTATDIDRGRVAELTARERELFLRRTARSDSFYERASVVMPNGVPSSFQAGKPRPVYLQRGSGASVWDVDGTEYVDFHNGFGVMCVGHANPKIAAAVKHQMDEGTHFAAPTEGSIVVAEELRRRFGLPHWRFTNSGTESTMACVHLARGATGRDILLKIEGSYHGHHDSVMVSVRPPLDQLGPRQDPASIANGAGYPRAIVELTRVVPFNDLDALERALERYSGQVAALIMEPAMMNINIVLPESGYLQGVRDLTARHGVQLIFDEVKTGATIAPGGATSYFGVTPDMIALAKATCGGLPGGSIGMSDEMAALVEDGTVAQYGTFNGNPLVMAAAQAALTEVLTDEAYAHFDHINRTLLGGLGTIIDRYGLPCYTVGLGAKGCVVFSNERLREYRDYATKVDPELSVLAWLYHMNHGIFMTPGVDEQWTLSVAHTDEHVGRYLEAFDAFAADVTGG